MKLKRFGFVTESMSISQNMSHGLSNQIKKNLFKSMIPLNEYILRCEYYSEL